MALLRKGVGTPEKSAQLSGSNRELGPVLILLLTEGINIYICGQNPGAPGSHLAQGRPGVEGAHQPISDSSLMILSRFLGSEPNSVQNAQTNFYQLRRK